MTMINYHIGEIFLWQLKHMNCRWNMCNLKISSGQRLTAKINVFFLNFDSYNRLLKHTEQTSCQNDVGPKINNYIVCSSSGIILWMCQANERRRDNVKSSLIGWAHAQNDPCTHFWMSVVLYSWVTPLLNIAEGNPTWQSSQWSDAAARLAVDGNDNPDLFAGSCSHTTDSDITEPPVWAVDLGHDLTDVYYVEVANRDYLEGKDLSNESQVYTCFPLVSSRSCTIFLVLLCGYQRHWGIRDA